MKALNNPKISIVICNYNYQEYVISAIESSINQTYQPHEVIVVDDGSTDRSIEIIKDYAQKVRLLTKSNGGQISAYNYALEYVSGDVVIFLDADDELLLNALQKIQQSFAENVVKAHGKMHIIDKNGNDLNSILPSTLDFGDCGKNLVKYGLMYKSPPGSGNAYRVDALKKIFPLPQTAEEKHGADYFCIYGVSLLGSIAAINEPIFKYRIHDTGNNISNSLGFGNAIKKHDRLKVSMRRWMMLRDWISKLLIIDVSLPLRFVDFTQQKYFFAVDVLNSNTLTQRCQVGIKHISWLSHSIFLRKDFNIIKKILLVCWMFLVLITPKKISTIIAKKVCNPV